MLKELIKLRYNLGFKKYLFNSIWLFAEQGLRIFSGLFVGVWVARYLGPEEYGIFSYSLAFTAIFAGIANLGLDGIMLRELINHPDKRITYLGTAFWLKVMGALFVLALIIIIVPFTNNDSNTNLFVFIIASGLVFQSFDVIAFYFHSKVLAKTISICKIFQVTLSSFVKVFLVLTEADLISFVFVSVFDALTLAVSFFVAYRISKYPSFFKHFNIHISKKLIKDSFPLIFSAIVVMIYMRIDQIMIKEMLGGYQVGIYSAAIKISESFYFLTLISTALFPAILNAKKESEQLYKRRLQLLYVFLVWIAISIALPMTFLSDWLILLLFGEAYLDAGQVLVIHIWSAVFVFLGVSFEKYLIIENLTKITFQRTLIGAISNLIFNFYFIPIYGILGAAFATLLAQFIANLGYDIFDKRLHEQLKMKVKAIFMPWLLLKI